ncbi:hypothetical protein BC830DRAFT_1122084 [Chytriomyces sp. MP71]|nr:hypothetical protein BC830DRAFT_1122084 [Chytriomyces sp. MP71]
MCRMLRCCRYWIRREFLFGLFRVNTTRWYEFFPRLLVCRIYASASLRDPRGLRTILIETPKITQKSYGNERRFLCPPPQITLLGRAWKPTDQDAQQDESALSVELQFGAAAPHESFTELLPRSHADASEAETRVAVFKGVYATGDEMAQRSVNADVRLDACGKWKMQSGPIRVVSKPTKRVSEAELLYSGSSVALFNRLKAQKCSTRYLAVSTDGTQLSVSAPHWDAWTLWRLDDPRFDVSRFPRKGDGYGDSHTTVDELVWHAPGVHLQGWTAPQCVLDARAANAEDAAEAFARDPLRFGDVVVLRNAVSGLVTRPLVLKSLECLLWVGSGAAGAIMDARVGECVGQMHRACFAKYEEEGKLLAVWEDVVGVFDVAVANAAEAAALSGNGWKHGSGVKRRRSADGLDGAADSAIWTIIGVGKTEYTFWMPHQTMQLTPPMALELPIQMPVITSIDTTLGRVWRIRGRHFFPYLMCFIGVHAASNTVCLCPEVLEVDVGILKTNKTDQAEATMVQSHEPIFLVDAQSGVVFRSGFHC